MNDDGDITSHGCRKCVFRTDDLDEAVEFVARTFGTHSRVPRSRGPLGYRVAAAATKRSVSGSYTCAVPCVVRAATQAVPVHLPLQHGAEYRVGRRALRSLPDVAVLLSPGHDYTVETPPGDALAFMHDPALLEHEIDLLGVRRPGTWTLKCTHLPMAPADVAGFRALVRQHGIAVGRAQTTGRADDCRAIEERLAAWLAARLVDAFGLAPVSPSSQYVARRVDDWIRQNVSQPITLEQLSGVAGVSARTVQGACLAHWGRTPLELVGSRRLEHVRSLLASGSMRTVTEAAMHSGISHLGRLSITYKRTFGESPSDTLAGVMAARALRYEARSTGA